MLSFSSRWDSRTRDVSIHRVVDRGTMYLYPSLGFPPSLPFRVLTVYQYLSSRPWLCIIFGFRLIIFVVELCPPFYICKKGQARPSTAFFGGITLAVCHILPLGSQKVEKQLNVRGKANRSGHAAPLYASAQCPSFC